MPRRRQKKKRERLLIREFLKELGYCVSQPAWTKEQENPDALLTIIKNNTRTRVGIELTEYYNDVPPGKSSKANLFDGYWRPIQSSLVRRFRHYPKLAHVSCRVQFKSNLPKPSCNKAAQDKGREVAGELVALANNTPLEPEVPKTIHPSRGSFLNLRALVLSVRLTLLPQIRVSPHCHWTCLNLTGGAIGMQVENVTKAVEDHGCQSRSYNWKDAEEKWLLIAAAGETPFARAGPLEKYIDWHHDDLRNACSCAGFDRIFFWERLRGWHKQMWPLAGLQE